MNAKIEFVLGIVFYVHNIYLIYQVQERRGHLLVCQRLKVSFLTYSIDEVSDLLSSQTRVQSFTSLMADINIDYCLLIYKQGNLMEQRSGPIFNT